MSCFRLPKAIITKLNSAISKFWWGNPETTKGIHWLKWRKVCKPKSVGGLGFRALEEFNTALLGKQLWRLIEFPNSLLAKVLKGRYYRNGNPLKVSNISSPSYGWRSITSARALLSSGIIRRIGNGRTTSVWHDPWIPDEKPRPALGFDPWLFPDMKVDQFINPITKTWREVPLRQFLHPDDVKLVLGIHISNHQREDSWGWHYSKSGWYNVRSRYRLEESQSSRTNSSYGPTVEVLQAQAWKIKCPGKIKNFMWQAISGCMAVKDKLISRGIIGENYCPRCGAYGESINHALFECPPARQAWALSSIPTPISDFPKSSVWSNMDYLFWRWPNQESFPMFPWILWNIWKARNAKVFSNKDIDPREVLQKSETEAREWAAVQVEGDPESGRSRSNWQIWNEVACPSLGNMAFTGFRCFVDAAWRSSDVFSGLGWACFTDSVAEGFSGGRAIPRCLSVLHAEFEAVIWAMECIQSMGVLEVEMATDSSTIVQMINNPEDWPAFSSYLEEFERLKIAFSFFKIHVIPRALNHRADLIAHRFRG